MGASAAVTCAQPSCEIDATPGNLCEVKRICRCWIWAAGSVATLATGCADDGATVGTHERPECVEDLLEGEVLEDCAGRPSEASSPFDDRLGPLDDGDVVASGEVGALLWQLWRAPGEDGATCVQIRSDPPLDGEIVRFDSAGLSSSTAVSARLVELGVEVAPSCAIPSSVVQDVADFGMYLLAVGGRESEVHYMAGLAGGVPTTITFSDGSTSELEPVDGVFALVWSGDVWPVLIESARGSCELAGDPTVSGQDDVCA